MTIRVRCSINNIEHDDHVFHIAKWAIVGQLTSTLIHEINNPMQTIRGAVSLALEDLNDTETLDTYLNLSLQESDRILGSIALIRRIYLQETDEPVPINVNSILQELLTLITKKLSQCQIELNLKLDSQLPAMKAKFSDFALALLCPILEISGKLADVGGGVLAISTSVIDKVLRVELSTTEISHPPDGIDLPVCHQILTQYGGQVVQNGDTRQTIVCLNLPISDYSQRYYSL